MSQLIPTYQQVSEALPIGYDGHINPFTDLLRELDMDLSENFMSEYENIYKKVVKENGVHDKVALYIYAFALVFVMFNKRMLIVNQRKIKAFVDLNKPDFLFIMLAPYVPRNDRNFEKDVEKVSEKFFRIIGPKEIYAVPKKSKHTKRKHSDSPVLVTQTVPRTRPQPVYKKVKYTKLNKVTKKDDPTKRIKTNTVPTYLLYRTIIDTPMQSLKKADHNQAVHDATEEDFKAFVSEKLKNGSAKTKEEMAEVKKHMADVISKQPYSFMKGKNKNPVLYKYAIKFRMDYNKKLAELDEKIHVLESQMQTLSMKQREEKITSMMQRMGLDPSEELPPKKKELTAQQKRMLKARRR